MTTEQNKALMRRFLEASCASDQSALRDLLAPMFVAHLPSGRTDHEGFLRHNNVFVVAFGDAQYTVEDQIAEGDKVVARTTWRGTHSGGFQGLPATGKQVAIGAFIVGRAASGRLVEYWSLFDQTSLMRQLGLVPPPQPSM